MKLSWNIGDTVEVVKSAVAKDNVGAKGKIVELCDGDLIQAYTVDLGPDHGNIWWYSEDKLKLISKAEER